MLHLTQSIALRHALKGESSDMGVVTNGGAEQEL